MTTFNGQSCVRGTAESCGERRDECGALGFVLTRMGQEMGSMVFAAAVFSAQRWRAAGFLQRAALGRSTPDPACRMQDADLAKILPPSDRNTLAISFLLGFWARSAIH